jgi:3-dehydroquinate synthetase
VPHGEAVALGLVLECELAEQLGLADSGLHHRVSQLLVRLGLPDRVPPEIDRTALIGSMLGDKKNRGGQIHFALPATLGRMHRLNGWSTPVPDTEIRRVLALSKSDS